MITDGRTFRIFISSTFSDLKAERNALQKRVFPRLRELCAKHGTRFQAVDLRWGVSEESSLDQQTMNICMGEIERCQRTTPRPNFILLLGDRYGWRPLPTHISANEFETLIEVIDNQEEIELLKRIEHMARTDELTGLPNRRSFSDIAKREITRSARYGTSLSGAMLDLDHFKAINDTYGHQIGDEVLRVVGERLKQNLKGKDFPSRYGGEEFAIILPNTEIRKAVIVAEFIRKEISNIKLKMKKTGETLRNISVSIGVSEIRSTDTTASVVERADTALYCAKNSGRNNVKSEV